MHNNSRIYSIKFIAGKLSLDFTNTVAWRGRKDAEDYFKTYTDFIIWAKLKKIITEEECNRILKNTEDLTEEKRQFLIKVKKTREILYQLFSQKNCPSEEIISDFNNETAYFTQFNKLRNENGIFYWDFTNQLDLPEKILGVVIFDAIKILTSPDLKKVAKCADNECAWLFFDTSRNHSRRWCSMEDCGNKAKARDFYQRKKIK